MRSRCKLLVLALPAKDYPEPLFAAATVCLPNGRAQDEQHPAMTRRYNAVVEPRTLHRSSTRTNPTAVAVLRVLQARALPLLEAENGSSPYVSPVRSGPP